MKPKIYFCTFSDSRLQPTLKRIENEANSSDFFDKVFIFNEFNLNKEFKKKFKDVLKYNVRGFGYWIWKVSIIQDVLSKLEDGDILLYADAGCSINKNGRDRFQDYIELVNESELGILAVSLEDSFIESKYTKGDLFDYLNVRNVEAIYNTPQIQAGVLLIRKNKNADTFLKQWQNIYEEGINFVNDEPSKKANFPDFITHRHDQSVFSVLFKIHKGVTIPLNEVWVKNPEGFELIKDNPIWVTRKKNKKITGLKYLFINWIKNVMGFRKTI
nr:hypothetical protein [uncultured Flavobacterium sp.]